MTGAASSEACGRRDQVYRRGRLPFFWQPTWSGD